MRLLIVANDLLVYAAAIAQPTGIQRVAMGLAEVLILEKPAFAADTLLIGVSRESARRVDPNQIGIGNPNRTPRRSARLAGPLLSLLARTPRRFQEEVRARARRLLASRATRVGAPIDVTADDWILVLGAPWIAPGTASATVALRRRSGARLAMLVHDLLPVTAPEWYADRQSREARDDVTALIDAADSLFGVSSDVVSEIHDRFGRDAIPLSPADPVLAHRQVQGFCASVPYILCVGTLHPRKRIDALIRALIAIATRRGVAATPRLIIAGRRHPQDTAVFAALDECSNFPRLRERITLVHDADDAHLTGLYAGCRFLVLPSLAEGWGIPVREALASGRPIIATDAVPAAAGSPFALIVPAGDDAALEHAIERWWSGDEPERLARRIAAEFSPRTWGEVARELVDGLVGSHRPRNRD